MMIFSCHWIPSSLFLWPSSSSSLFMWSMFILLWYAASHDMIWCPLMMSYDMISTGWRLLWPVGRVLRKRGLWWSVLSGSSCYAVASYATHRSVMWCVEWESSYIWWWLDVLLAMPIGQWCDVMNEWGSSYMNQLIVRCMRWWNSLMIDWCEMCIDLLILFYYALLVLSGWWYRWPSSSSSSS